MGRPAPRQPRVCSGRRRTSDAEPRGELGVRITAPQVAQDQQRPATGRQATPFAYPPPAPWLAGTGCFPLPGVALAVTGVARSEPFGGHRFLLQGSTVDTSLIDVMPTEEAPS